MKSNVTTARPLPLLTLGAALLCLAPAATHASPGVAEMRALLASTAPGDVRKALESLVASEPANAEALYLLAKALYDLREYDQAEEPAQKAVELRPGESDHHLLLGRVTAARLRPAGLLSKFGMARRIRSEFEAAVAANPRNFDARLALTAFYAEAPWFVGGGLAKAYAQAGEIAALSPMEGHLALAEIHESRGEWGEVEKELREAVRADPGSAKAHARLATLLLQKKKTAEAEALFTISVSLDPEYLPAHYYLGRIYVEGGKSLPTAETYLKKYLTRWPAETSPTWAATHWFLSKIYEAQGRKELAAAETREVYRLAPNFAPSCSCSF
jgi:tetratricopeptide (TPR) repeat protein